MFCPSECPVGSERATSRAGGGVGGAVWNPWHFLPWRSCPVVGGACAAPAMRWRSCPVLWLWRRTVPSDCRFVRDGAAGQGAELKFVRLVVASKFLCQGFRRASTEAEEARDFLHCMGSTGRRDMRDVACTDTQSETQTERHTHPHPPCQHLVQERERVRNCSCKAL